MKKHEPVTAKQFIRMKKEMFEAEDDERYEEAAVLRDKINEMQKAFLKKFLRKDT